MLARKAIVREHSGAAFGARETAVDDRAQSTVDPGDARGARNPRRPLAVGLGEVAHAHHAIAQRQC